MPLNRVSISRLVLGLSVLLFTLSAPARAQESSARDKELVQQVPINPLLKNHTNWFDPVKIYDLRLKNDHYPLPDELFPKEIKYDVYSAVGYDLANTMVIKDAKNSSGQREVVIVDTLGNPGITKEVINIFRDTKGVDGEYIFPHDQKDKIPIRAIIYTHNHIDHTFGVWGYLTEADRPPCQQEDPTKPGPDGYFDVDKENKECVAVIGQSKINDGVGTTAFITGTIIDARSSYMYGNFLRNYKEGGNQVNDGIGPQEYGCCWDAKTQKCISVREKGKECIQLQGSYRMPSRTFSEELYVTAAGVQMKIIYVPSETNDELAVFLPDKLNSGGNIVATALKPDDWWGRGLLFSAEVIQGPSFPNLYSLRGTSFRNPATWYRSVDKLRAYDSWCMVPSHGPPVCEAENIHRLLRNFRDAVQFTHDQTIRWMNKGFTMDELAPLVETLYLQKDGEEEIIMKDLDNVKPILNVNAKVVDPRDYLRPFYGSVTQGVREVYAGNVGWFQADPVGLRPTPPHELGIRYLKVMGGATKVNAAASEALTKGVKLLAEAKAENSEAKLVAGRGEVEWAAELTTNVVQAYVTPESLLGISSGSGNSTPSPVSKEDFQAAKNIKADAFLKLGELAENPNWRNWYITAAHELKGQPFPPAIPGGLVSPGVQGGLPAGAWVSSLSLRLKAEKTAPAKVDLSLGFWFPANSDQGFGALGYVVKIRNGIAEFIENTPHGDNLALKDVESANLAISIEKRTLDELLIAEMKGEQYFWAAFELAVKNNDIKPLNQKTTINDFKAAFTRCFDPKPVGLPPLTVR
jgi:alkyl sulfatase BDS1-like metallo-beta-lactamase superfamily hydrolase